MPLQPISSHDQHRLTKLEEVIKLDASSALAHASLRIILAERLWRQDFESSDDYLAGRFPDHREYFETLGQQAAILAYLGVR